MNSEYLIIDCPKNFDNRADEIKRSIEVYLRSNVIRNLVKLFNEDVPQNRSLIELSKWLVDFSEVWDFRKKQKSALDKKTGEFARWLVNDDTSWSDEKRNLILESARIMGLIDEVKPKEDEYDYFLVLGGARYTCHMRPKLAAEFIYNQGFMPKKVVLLATSRPVSDSERIATDTYAPEAETEFDLILAGARKVFELGNLYKNDKYDDANKNKSWNTIEYSQNGNTPEVLAISAPSSDPEQRRANSADTYEFFLNNYKVDKGSKILLLTSQIYVPYQHMEAIRTIAFKYDVYVETVGIPPRWTGVLPGMRNPVHYLQEIRATLVSIDRFLKEYKF
ncbi:MAG: hypothetical protein ABF289_02305 [Clostridiales bacterium]